MKEEIRHFLDIHTLSTQDLRRILNYARKFKEKKGVWGVLFGKTLVLIFEQPSTRTRVSFEVGMRKLGGNVVVLYGHEIQLRRGESLADTARVLSRYGDAIMLRTDHVKKLEELALHSDIPVINGLTDVSHPCQVLADVMCYEEHRGKIEGCKVAWCGDGNNVAESWVHAAIRFDFCLYLACPLGFEVREETLLWAKESGGRVVVTREPKEAVSEADCVVTDSWMSMTTRRNVDKEKTRLLLEPYRVDEELMTLAKHNALFMHCLPAYRGEEVSTEVLEGPWSVVWDEAEDRLYVQQAILVWSLLGKDFI